MPPGNRIFTTIDVNYGREALQLARRWEKTVLRQASTYAQLHFLHRCLANYVMPKCLSYKPPVNTELAKQTVFRHSRRMTRVLIQDCHLRLKNYAHSAENYRMLVTCRCGESTAASLENTLLALGRKKRANRDADLSIKFMTLQTAQDQETEQTIVRNLSSKQLTVTQTKVLQRGSGFNTTDADPVTFIASFESVLRQTGATDEVKDLLRHQVSSLLMSHRKTHALLRDEQKALRELKTDTEIVILPADKGRSTVILDKVDYRRKALLLLNDRESYKVSDAASQKSLVAKVNRTLARLKKGQGHHRQRLVYGKARRNRYGEILWSPKSTQARCSPPSYRLAPRHTHIRACKLAISEAKIPNCRLTNNGALSRTIP
nr:unnamed protein product [Spirometra erinaceieuropaei]